MAESQLSPHFVSQLPGLRWPAISDDRGGHLVSLLYQYEQSQWFPPDRLWECQARQLAALLEHAATTVPFYRDRLGSSGWKPGQPITLEQWRGLPLLTRREMQEHFDDICSRALPPMHGKAQELKTSGSTGQPVRYSATALTHLVWQSLTLRFHLWHRHDFRNKLCVIRAPHGPVQAGVKRGANWGAPTCYVFESGSAAMMDCRHDVAELLDFVAQEKPAYLLSLPSTLAGMARLSLERGLRLPGLQQVNTHAETVTQEMRESFLAAWGAPVVDMYSCQEAGYLAFQCPDHPHYHVQSECVLLEVLDDAGQPCGPGQIGRVVITPLVNFASPLIRYELQDYAEVGEPCPCGRGLPVLRSIRGRKRNLIVTPDGRRYWPVLQASSISHLAPIRQFQLVQKTPSHFDVTLVMDRRLTDPEQAALTTALAESLGYPFTFRFQVQRERMLTDRGKFESIISNLA